MNKDSWVAFVIATIITIIATTPLYYSRDYIRGSKDKISEGSDIKITLLVKEIKESSEPNN